MRGWKRVGVRLGPLAQWIEHQIADLKARGSSPLWPAMPIWECSCQFGQQKYLAVSFREHPTSWANGFVYVHVLVAECKIGRRLRKAETVHHANEDPLDNRPENILVLPSPGAHTKLHPKQRTHGRFVKEPPKKLPTLYGEAKRQLVAGFIYETRYCRFCGHETRHGDFCSVRCASRGHGKMQMKSMPSNFAEELLTMPLEALGRKYGMSGNAIKKHAKKLGLLWRAVQRRREKHPE